MSNLKERLDLLREEIQKQDFLEGKGLSNEVNIRIFCYDSSEEMIVTHFLEQIKTDQSLRCRLVECNLYKTFLSICDDLDIMDAIPDMEEADGGDFLLEQLHSLLEALQPYFSDIPILVMYPGEFDGHYLKLFGRLTPNDYYRAFNIIGGGQNHANS